ncbi:MAG TPA: DUF5050 domain-containing protein [Firmicutes bacterium]|nr:DUF5050 domain-containing protein [Bacillota bacterium]
MPVLEESFGNTPGNLKNYGYAAARDGWIYYRTDKGLYRAPSEGGREEFLAESPNIANINVPGDGWVYFTEYGYLYRLRPEEKSWVLLAEEVSQAQVVGNVIYFMDFESDAFFRINTDGSDRRAILADTVFGSGRFNIAGDRVYVGDNLNLASFRLDGSDLRTARNVNTQGMIVEGDAFYSTGGISRFGLDGTFEERLLDHGCITMNVADGWIYYAYSEDPLVEEEYLWKMRTDGSDRQQLNELCTASICIVDGWIYYTVATPISPSSCHSLEYRRMRLDGTQDQSIG